MPNSVRFRTLSKRVNELRKHLLPVKFAPTGSYSQRELDRSRGYRLLVHAEIEAFIEDIAWNAVRSKVGEWQNLRRPSDLLVCFLACYHAGWGDIEDIDEEEPFISKASGKEANKGARDAVNYAMTQYRQRVDRNHGIREKNIHSLLLPVGIRLNELDSAWLADIEAFGVKRGEVAHKAIGVQQNIDPQTELQTVKRIMEGLRKLDELILLLAT